MVHIDGEVRAGLIQQKPALLELIARSRPSSLSLRPRSLAYRIRRATCSSRSRVVATIKRDLWRMLEPLALYFREEPITYEALADLGKPTPPMYRRRHRNQDGGCGACQTLQIVMLGQPEAVNRHRSPCRARSARRGTSPQLCRSHRSEIQNRETQHRLERTFAAS